VNEVEIKELDLETFFLSKNLIKKTGIAYLRTIEATDFGTLRSAEPEPPFTRGDDAVDAAASSIFRDRTGVEAPEPPPPPSPLSVFSDSWSGGGGSRI
jgi:hypothetical protein